MRHSLTAMRRNRDTIATPDRQALAAVLALTATMCGGCFLPACPRDVRGLHEGDTLHTTIVGPATGVDPGLLFGPGMAPPSCHGLPDLPTGAVLTSVVKLLGPGDDCADGVLLRPRSLTAAQITSTPDGPTVVQLASGCTGTIAVRLGSASASAGYLDDSAGTWWLVRTFRPRGDPALCFPGGTPPVECSDAFAVRNTL
jgi:hypothetical protein